MQAVVVGASGFIGSHLVDGLLQHGYRVKALARHLPGLIGTTAQAHSDLSLIPMDMADGLATQEAFAGADVVFHLASGSLPQSSNRDPQADVQVNLIGALKMLEAARQAQQGTEGAGRGSGGGAAEPTTESLCLLMFGVVCGET